MLLFFLLLHLCIGVRRGEETGICLPWKFGLRTKIFCKPWSHQLKSDWFNSCNDTLFAGMTLTLRKRQVHCSGVMYWWACSLLTSAPLHAETCCETFDSNLKKISKMTTLPPWKNFCGRPRICVISWFESQKCMNKPLPLAHEKGEIIVEVRYHEQKKTQWTRAYHQWRS